MTSFFVYGLVVSLIVVRIACRVNSFLYRDLFGRKSLQGKAGDYLGLNEDSGWPVDRHIFEQSYALAEEENKDIPEDV